MQRLLASVSLDICQSASSSGPLPCRAVTSDYNLVLMRLVDEEYTRHPSYGSRKIKRWLPDHYYGPGS